MHPFNGEMCQNGVKPGPDSGISKTILDPLDPICKCSNLQVVGFLLFLDCPNNPSQLLILMFECSKMAIRHPISVDISENPSISKAIQGMVNSLIERVV